MTRMGLNQQEMTHKWALFLFTFSCNLNETKLKKKKKRIGGKGMGIMARKREGKSKVISYLLASKNGFSFRHWLTYLGNK